MERDDAHGEQAGSLSEQAMPLTLSHAEMNAAYNTGEAVPLADTISWLVRYRQAWWVLYERGWLRVTDEVTAADLDDRAYRMTPAQAQAARDTHVRAALGRDYTATEQEAPCPPPHS